MTTARTIARSFAGGELSPELVGRMDLDKYQTGLALCKNFISLPHGPAQNRPGFAYVNQCKDSTRRVRLIPFSFSADETIVLEFGHLYIRFHTNGGTLLEPLLVIGDVVGNLVEVTSHGYVPGNWVFIYNRFYIVATVPDVNHFTVNDLNGAPINPDPTTAGGVNRVHEVATPYTENVLFDIHYVQSSDVLTLVHPSFRIKELRRYAAVMWSLLDVSFAPVLVAPTGVAVTPTIGAGTTSPRDYEYVVTSINSTGVEESAASASVIASGQNLSQMVNSNRVSWSAALGADRYSVYRKQGGVFGYVGQTSDLYFDDNNILPDTLRTPPEGAQPFETPNNYPSAVAYFDQRRVFAATNNNPQTLWMTKAGSETNLTTSLPVQDDDSISFKIAARQQNRIRHMVPLSDLILLTAGGEWRVFTGTGEPVTPSTVIARPQSYVGANNVQPVVTSLSAIYVSAQGSKFRELIYSAEGVGTYKSEDLSVLIPHMTNGYLVTDLAFSRGPTPLAWAVRSDGTLLGLTYLPEQVVRGWHQHTTTNGAFESVCCVAEGNEDVLYAVVRRTIDGISKRYVERLNSQLFATPEDAFFVDSGATYVGAPATTISGLWHLEGETVAILGDGAVFPEQVVVDGTITLEEPVSKAQIGLPIVSELQTLPLAIEGLATGGPSFVKNVTKAFLRVYRSSGVFIGPDADHLTEYKQRTEEPYGSAPALTTGEIEVPITPTWSKDGSVYIRQIAPLPLTIQSLALEVAVGR
jgi:hypothetical protein